MRLFKLSLIAVLAVLVVPATASAAEQPIGQPTPQEIAQGNAETQQIIEREEPRIAFGEPGQFIVRVTEGDSVEAVWLQSERYGLCASGPESDNEEEGRANFARFGRESIPAWKYSINLFGGYRLEGSRLYETFVYPSSGGPFRICVTAEVRTTPHGHEPHYLEVKVEANSTQLEEQRVVYDRAAAEVAVEVAAKRAASLKKQAIALKKCRKKYKRHHKKLVKCERQARKRGKHEEVGR